MDEKDSEVILGILNSQNVLFLMDKKIIKPFSVPGSNLFEKYRTKLVRDQSGNDMMRVDYDPSPDSQGGRGVFGKLQQLAVGMLNFKVGDLNGNYIYSIRADHFMTTTHNFRIMDGDESRDRFSATHKMMALGRNSLVITGTDSATVLSSQYNSLNKAIEVAGPDGIKVATLHAPIISMRDRWQLDFSGESDRALVIVMVAIMSELGQKRGV